MRRTLLVLLALSLLMPVTGSIPLAAPSSAMRTSDPLVKDSIAAMASLVASETGACTEKDAADANPGNGSELPYIFCDDGLTPRGGGAKGIPVPVKYRAHKGNDYRGLPPPASLEETAAADAKYDLRPESGNRITLDVDVSLPPTAGIVDEHGFELPVRRRPRGGFPVIVFMHGCCSGNKTSWEADTIVDPGERWHHSNAWFAARGYVVINYTARGFRNSREEGSTGTTQLDSRRFEINDYQYLVGLLADHDAARRAAGERPVFDINPTRVSAVGGSYGGGFAWLAVTDPTWRSPGSRTPLRLAAAVPKYGWTDLVESLVPGGHYFDVDPRKGLEEPRSFVAPVDPAEALSRRPVGVVKESIVTGLYASGNARTGNHTTFPRYLDEAYLRFQRGEPYQPDPGLERLVGSFLRDRSAYFQQGFWDRVRNGLRVPIYAPGTWTDPLFPTMETIRFHNKLKSLAPGYPISMHFGDYQHFVANKAKEWGNMCGDDHHVCTVDDQRNEDGDLELWHTPSIVRTGINTRINRFLNHYGRGRPGKPPLRVTATTTICAANATERLKVDEPGIEYRAPTWRALAPRFTSFTWDDAGTTFSSTRDEHAEGSDPVARSLQPDKCYTTGDKSPGPGVVQVSSEPLSRPLTMMGLPILKLRYQATGSDYWIEGRLFDEDPTGKLTLVTRGPCRVNEAAAPKVGCRTFSLFGNGWRFEKGHRLVLELTQSDTPFLRPDNFPSQITFDEIVLKIPVVPARLRHDFRD